MAEPSTDVAVTANGVPRLSITGLQILAVSFIALYQELTLIRWLPAQVRVLAYFPNLILISAFLGLGVGCLRAGRRSLMWTWPFSLLALVATAAVLGRVVFTQQSVSDHLWLLYYDLPDTAPVFHSVRPPIVIFFVLCSVSFIALGQFLAERLNFFRRHSSSLWGYSWDLLGSLLGVVAFTVTGFLGVFPWLWFALVMVASVVCLFPDGRWRVTAGLIGIVIVTTVSVAERAQLYSPYYAISTVPGSQDAPGFSVLANGALHQQATALKRTDSLSAEWATTAREGYHAPYRHLMRRPRTALVLGAGTGNDVAVLLDEGVEHVDAVEIDPEILALGHDHPDNPYGSQRVRLINTDARRFLNSTDKVYDLIVFGTLDSMTRLSALSNVRLDNFVYTRECLQVARQHLSDDGGLVLYFMVSTTYIDQRLYALVADVFHELPAVRTTYSFLFNRVFMAGPAFAHLERGSAEQQRAYFERILPLIEVPTDDWPYLYLRSREISPFYLSLIGIFVAISIASVALASKQMRSSLGGRGPIDLEMFLFGAAFLLIETKFVTAMSLVWGATWLTSAVVFGAVLLMVLLSTLVMELSPMPWWLAAGGLTATLVATYFVPMRWLLLDGSLARLAASVLFVGAPIFFAAACFAMRFRVRPDANVAFGWNLLGAVSGGLLEFLSMVIGLKALSLVALAAYLGAFWVRERQLNDRHRTTVS